MFAYLGCKISYEEEKDNFKHVYIFTNNWNCEQRFKTRFLPKTISNGSI